MIIQYLKKLLRNYGIRYCIIKLIGKILKPNSELFLCDKNQIDEEKSKTMMITADPNYYEKLSAEPDNYLKMAMSNYEILTADYIMFLDNYSRVKKQDLIDYCNYLYSSSLNQTPSIIDESLFYYIWTYSEISSKLLETIQSKENTGDIQLMIICELFYQKNDEQAKKLLSQYCKKDDITSISNYLPAAYLAKTMNITNNEIEKSAVVFENFIKTIDFFNQYDTIMIIGNGEIDEKITIPDHEKIGIIRINQYDESLRLNNDIWLRNNDPDYLKVYHKMSTDGLKMIMTDKDIWHYKFDDIVINDFYQYVQNDICIGYLSNIKEIYTRFGIQPTSGFAVIYYLKETHNMNIKLYGFSSDNSHVYLHKYRKEDINKQSIHSLRHDKQFEINYYKINGWID